MSYEEQNWSRLSPRAREAYNKRRVLRGLPPLSEPKVDQWTGNPQLSSEDRERFKTETRDVELILREPGMDIVWTKWR